MGKPHEERKPRGRLSAYGLFMEKCREEHKRRHQSVVSTDFSGKCASRWKFMSEQEKLGFLKMAETCKMFYEQEAKEKAAASDEGPKPALSAYYWFVNDESPKVREEMGSKATVGEIAFELKKRWKGSPPEVKDKYQTLADQDEARYTEEVAADAVKTSAVAPLQEQKALHILEQQVMELKQKMEQQNQDMKHVIESQANIIQKLEQLA